jgi:hypothetical protein
MLLVWMCKSKVTVACWYLSVLYAFLSRFLSILKDRRFVFKNRKPYHSKTRDLGVFSVVKKRRESVQFHRRSKKSLKMWLFCSEVPNAIESSMPNAWKALKTSTDIECWATILIGTRKLSSTLSNYDQSYKAVNRTSMDISKTCSLLGVDLSLSFSDMCPMDFRFAPWRFFYKILSNYETGIRVFTSLRFLPMQVKCIFWNFDAFWRWPPT